MTTLSKLAILAGCAILRGLSDEQKQDLANQAAEKRFASGSLLFRADEPAGYLFLLASGRVKLSIRYPEGRDAIIQLLAPGELCGWRSVLREVAYTETARAVGPVRALAWTKEVFEVHLAQMPGLSRSLLNMATDGLREQETRFLQLAGERVPQRLARALLRLSGPAGLGPATDKAWDVPLSRDELAQMTGTTLFTVSRILCQWQTQGLVRTGRGHVVIDSRRGLDEIAGEVHRPAGASQHPRSHS